MPRRSTSSRGSGSRSVGSSHCAPPPRPSPAARGRELRACGSTPLLLPPLAAKGRDGGALMPPSHFLLILAICLAWGGNFLAAAFALKHFPPFLFTALRLAVVLACLLPFLKPIARAQRLRLAAIALCAGALHFGLNF